MDDLISLWRDARGPEPELPDAGIVLADWRDDVAAAMHAHYAAAVTEDALARFVALLIKANEAGVDAIVAAAAAEEREDPRA